MRPYFLGWFLVSLLVLSACTHMPGIVKDVNWDNDGNLVLRKCDSRHYWVVYFIVWAESNCRDEKKNARQLLAKLDSPLSRQPSVGAPMNVLALQSDVDRVTITRPSAKKNAYAIVVGIENYRDNLPKADFAASDAKLMGEYLIKVLGYPEENVVVRLNANATRNDLEKYVELWLPNHVEKDGSVFIYFSGHGAPNLKTGEGYIVPYDGDPTFIDKT